MTKKRNKNLQADWANDYIETAKTRAELLHNAIREAEHSLKTAPQGMLRDIKHGKDYQYFWRKEKSDVTGIYLSKKSEGKTIKELAQKEYNLKFLKAAKEELRALDKYLAVREKGEVGNVYDSMNVARRYYVTPFITPDIAYVKEWEDREYEPGYFAPGYPEYYSVKDERVRSKAEENIANLLKMNNVPYHYEYPIMIGGEEKRPDFLCLNVRTKKEYIWEHFGMMDNMEYALRNVEKINKMAANGYIHGQNCIFTFETSMLPLNTRVIQLMIDEFLV